MKWNRQNAAKLLAEQMAREVSGLSFRPSKTKVSNRTIIDRMKEWGWVEQKSNNDYVSMRAINGATMDMAAPQSHANNGVQRIDAMLNRMSQFMTWDVFMGAVFTPEMAEFLRWMAEADTVSDVEKLLDALLIETKKAAIEAERRHEHDHADDANRPVPKYKPKQKQIPKEEPVSQPPAAERPAPVVTDPEPPSAPQKPVRLPITTPTVDLVYDIVASSPEPMVMKDIRRELVAVYDVSPGMSTVSVSCSNLVNEGMFLRTAPGVYIAAEGSYRDDDGRHPAPRQVEPLIQAPQPTVPEPVLAPTPPPTPEEMFTEELITEVLDLLLPNGFKARHLPAITRWHDATAQLIKEVTDGA